MLTVKQFSGLFFSANWEACLWRELYKKSYNLICKAKKKKIINFRTLISQLNLGWKTNENVVVFYYKPAFLALIKLLKKQGFIYDYKVLPSNSILAGIPQKILLTKYYSHLLVIYIYGPVGGFCHQISLVSKPSRPIYMPHTKLLMLFQKINNSESVYVLNTTQGLVTLNSAVQNQLGGCLLCRIN